MKIQLFSMAYPVTVLGPGHRVVLWVTGCDKECPGCISPEMMAYDAGKPVPVKSLVKHLLQIQLPLNGITISGGEPFDQAPALAECLQQLREARPEWNVLIFTGYLLEAIQADTANRAVLLAQADIVIDGPYRREIPRVHPLTGSGNQRVHYLTDKGRSVQPELDAFIPQQMNYGIGDGSFDMIIGVTDEPIRNAVCKWMDSNDAEIC